MISVDRDVIISHMTWTKIMLFVKKYKIFAQEKTPMTEIRVVVAARYIPVPGYIIHLWEQGGGGG
jgi:hypothetical protein